MSGLDCLRRLKPLLPATEFIVFTAPENAETICEALKAGANGCLTKPATREEFPQRNVTAGVSW